MLSKKEDQILAKEAKKKDVTLIAEEEEWDLHDALQAAREDPNC